MTLAPEQIDALKELVTVTCGHAVGALSKLLGGRPIFIDVPRAEVATVEHVADLLGDRHDSVVEIRLGMEGDLTGEFLLVQKEADAGVMGNALIGSGDLDSQFVRSALCEAGNILASSCFTAMARFVGLKLMPSVPTLVREAVENLVLEAIARHGDPNREALLLETRFSASGEGSFSGLLVLLPDEASVQGMVRALTEKAASLARA